MEVKLEESMMMAAMTKAIIESLTDEAKERLLTDAVTKVLAPVPASGHYGSKPQPSPLQAAFDRAVEQWTNQWVKEQVFGNEELQATLKTKLGEAVLKLAKDNFDFGDVLGRAMANALRERD